MKSAQLLAHFDRISEAPDAIPRLRRFILNLAVRGKLAEQDPRDEPASQLLKRIEAERVQLIKKQGSIAQLEPAKIWQVPADWVFVPLEMLAMSAGLFTDGDWVESKDQDPNGDVRLTQLADVGTGEYRNRSSRFMNAVTAARLNCTFLNKGDILIARMPDPLGRACIFLGDPKPCVTVVDVAVLRLGSQDFDAAYVVHAINSPQFAKNVQSKAAGTTRSRISRGNLSLLPFPLPPLAEQHRIVAKVDELMALCDRLEAAQAERESRRDRLVVASLHRLNNGADPDAFREYTRFYFNRLQRLTTRSEHIQQLRQTILNLAVRGQLVPQDPNDEPASELLIRIQAEKARLLKEGKIGPEKPPIPARVDELAFELKPGWQAARISQILVELQTGPFGSSLHQSDYQKGGIPVINPASIKNERLVPVESMAVGQKTLNRLSTFKLRAGDIVMARRGEMGRCAVVNKQENGWLCGTGSLILRLPEFVFPHFFVTLIGSPFVREYLGGSAVGATMQNLNQSILLNLVIGLPPLAEQHRIVAKVEELMALCDRLEVQLTTAQTESRRLLEATLHYALPA